MGSAGRFSALNTKIQSMRGDLLQQQDYEQMFQLNSTREIAQYLYSDTVYRDSLKDSNLKEIHRGELEILLRNDEVKRIQKLSYYLKKEYKDFLKAILFRYEVENVQILLRGIGQSRPVSDIESKLFAIQSYLDLDYKQILRCTSIDEVISFFQGTILEDAFRNVTEEDIKTREFHIEMNTDYAYFLNLSQKAEKLEREDREIAETIIGLFVDLINFQWIYRAKLNYTLMDEEILNYTLQDGNKLTFKKMKDLIYSSNFEEQFKELFSKTYKGLEHIELVNDQRAMHKYLICKLNEIAKDHPMSIAALMEYIHLVEYENLNMIAVVEGAKYKEADKWQYIIPTTAKMRREGR